MNGAVEAAVLGVGLVLWLSAAVVLTSIWVGSRAPRPKPPAPEELGSEDLDRLWDMIEDREEGGPVESGVKTSLTFVEIDDFIATLYPCGQSSIVAFCRRHDPSKCFDGEYRCCSGCPSHP